MVVRNPRPGERGEKGVEAGETLFAGTGFNFASSKLKECKKSGTEEKSRTIVFTEAAPHGWVIVARLRGTTGVIFGATVLSPTETRIDPRGSLGEAVTCIIEFFAKAV